MQSHRMPLTQHLKNLGAEMRDREQKSHKVKQGGKDERQENQSSQRSVLRRQEKQPPEFMQLSYRVIRLPQIPIELESLLGKPSALCVAKRFARAHMQPSD